MKNSIQKLITIGVCGIVVLSLNSFAGVTVHGTTNGVTTVSCTGGCTMAGGLLGIEVCDSNDVCLTVRGNRVRTQSEPNKET